MTTVADGHLKFMKSPVGRLIVVLTALIIILICLAAEYIRINKPFLQDLASRWRDHHVGPTIARDTQLLRMDKLLPINKVRLNVEDQNDCLKDNNIGTTSLKRQIANELGVEISDTADDAPIITLTVFERSAAPFSFRTFIIMSNWYTATNVVTFMPGPTANRCKRL
jgi:hypothetical protein